MDENESDEWEPHFEVEPQPELHKTSELADWKEPTMGDSWEDWDEVNPAASVEHWENWDDENPAATTGWGKEWDTENPAASTDFDTTHVDEMW